MTRTPIKRNPPHLRRRQKGLAVTLPGEEWRAIAGRPEYEVSNLGRVREIKRGRLISPYESRGYLSVKFYRMGETPKAARVHRLVCEAFHGSPAHPKMHVNHKDFNRSNNQSDNVEWMTLEENRAHTVRAGRHSFGVRNARSKLNPEIVQTIRTLYGGGARIADLARKFGVSRTTAGYAAKRIYWKSVGGVA